MANFTYETFYIPYPDTLVEIYEADTTTTPTFYDESDTPVSGPAFNGGTLTFRVPEGFYDIIVTHASAPGHRATTRISVPDDLDRPLHSIFLANDVLSGLGGSVGIA